MIIVIDNYDSFTYNLVQYLGELGAELPVANEVQVYRNDQISLEAIALATDSPRKAIGLSGIIGKYATQLLRWHLNEPTKELTWHRLF